jgi:hypothetical protein
MRPLRASKGLRQFRYAGEMMTGLERDAGAASSQEREWALPWTVFSDKMLRCRIPVLELRTAQ